MGRSKIAHLPVECGELGDAISADAVDADAHQCFPLVGVVSGPGNDPGVDRVRSCNQLFIDERHFLPEILCSARHERRDRIDMTRILQHARSHRRENRFYGFDNAMVEGVNGAGRLVLADNTHDERLDAGRLDLDVDHGINTNGAEHCSERGNLHVLGEPKISELGGRQLGNWARRESGRIDDRVVVNDYNSVVGGMDVELDRLGAQLQRAQKSGDGVLGQGLMRPSMRDLLRRPSLQWGVQVFSRVVALGTMSAKL